MQLGPESQLNEGPAMRLDLDDSRLFNALHGCSRKLESAGTNKRRFFWTRMLRTTRALMCPEVAQRSRRGYAMQQSTCEGHEGGQGCEFLMIGDENREHQLPGPGAQGGFELPQRSIAS